MDKKQMIVNWILKAEKDIESAKDMLELNHFDWSLFIWHLVIEKILKAKIISEDKKIIYTHDLTRLTKITNITLDHQLITELNEITTFNIEARYDDYKLSFYKKATKEYTQKWSAICEKIYNLFKKSI